MTEETHTDNAAPAQQEAPLTPAREAAPPLQSTAPQTENHRVVEVRRATRFVVKWRAAIALGSGAEQVIYHGWLKDISISGTALFSERAIPHSPLIELHIEVPAINTQKERILTLQARIIYSLHDGSAHQFRTGIEFVKFASSNDQSFLATYLNKNCHSKAVEITKTPSIL